MEQRSVEEKLDKIIKLLKSINNNTHKLAEEEDKGIPVVPFI